MTTHRDRCPAWEDLSAQVDGSLRPADADRVNRHLVACESCRAQLKEIRQMRELLRGHSGTTPLAGDALPDRLRSIAGSGVDQPLWARPFDQPGADGPVTPLPSVRRAQRRRRLVASGGAVAVAAGVFLLGWMAAPALHGPVEPMQAARSGFAAAMVDMPLAAVAPGTSSMGRESAIGESTFNDQDGPSVEDISHLGSLSTAPELDCFSELRRAQTAAFHTPVSGTQVMQSRTDGLWSGAKVNVVHVPGQGTKVNHDGGESLTVPSAGPLSEINTLLPYHLQCTRAVSDIAGRSAAPVELASDSGTRIRWWIDTETGYVLWTDRFAGDQVQARAGFVDVTVGPSAEVDSDTADDESVAPVADSQEAADVALGMERQRPTLADLPLISVSTTDDGAIHSVYGDCLTTVLVSQQPGSLPAASHATTEPVMHGAVAVSSWQSKNTVWTVVTDGSPDIAERVGRELPREPASDQGVIEKVMSGWEWIGAKMGLR